MNRQFIIDTIINEKSFLKRLHNGIEIMNDEINKLESITNNLIINNEITSKQYFQQETLLLNDADDILTDAHELYSNITTNIDSINLDNYENRLLKLRERLLEFENNDIRLLKKNYKPFRPKEDDLILNNGNDNQLIDDENIDNDNITELINDKFQKNLNINDSVVDNGNSNINQNNNNNDNGIMNISINDNKNDDKSFDNSFSVLSTIEKISSIKKTNKPTTTIKNSLLLKSSAKKLSKKIDLSKCDNPMATHVMAIYNRWIKNDDDDDTVNNKLSNNQDCKNFINQNQNTTSSVKNNNKSDLYTTTPLKIQSSNKKEKIAKNFNNNNINNDEYETIEFTPGMTTKVRKSMED